MIKISVIIPTYNRKKQLRNALDSVIAQSYKNIEIIVSDDGSTDGTKEMIQNSYHNIIYIENKHSGIPAIPRNKAINKANGEYIAFLDSDDVWNKLKLEKQIKEIQETKVDFCCTNAKVVDQSNKKIKNLLIATKKKQFKFIDILKENKIICSSVLISKKILKEQKGFPETKKFKGFEDYGLWLRVLITQKVIFINQPLVTYTDNPKKSVRRESLNYTEQTFVVIDFVKDNLKSKNIFSRMKYFLPLCIKSLQISLVKQ